MRTAIVMPTIRAQAARVVELFLQDVTSVGIDQGDISLYFSIDPPLSVNAGSIQVHGEHASGLRLVRYIDGRCRTALAQHLLSQSKADSAVLGRLLVQRGYASARNAAIIQALRDENDVVINIDDDVLPLIPRARAKRNLEWSNAGFVQTHLLSLTAGADITRGGYLGYASPLVDLTSTLPQECLAALGLALSLGNEVLAPDCLSNPPSLRVLTAADEAEAYVGSRPSQKGMIIYGGNVGISLRALQEGRIPVFFCPEKARGEDTFFGFFLPGRARVDTVPARVFHDPFRLYPGLLQRRYPVWLMPRVPPVKRNLRRFAAAFRGWVRYAPLWIRCQYDDPQRRTHVLTMIEGIYRNHASCLAALGLSDVVRVFGESVGSMEADFELLHELNRLWWTSIAPYL